MSRLLLAIALALSLAACSGPQPEALRVGTAFDEPGLSLSVQSERVGLATTVARSLATELGAETADDLLFTQSTERTRGADVAGHAVRFALGTADLPPERADQVTAVGPYLVSGLQLALSPSAGPTPRRVCVVGGSTAERRLPSLLPAAAPAARRSLSTCLTETLDGAHEAVLADGVVLAGYLRGPAYARLRLAPERLTRDEQVVLVPRDRPEDCRRLTSALRRFVSSGSWATAVQGDLVTPGILDAVPPAPVVHGCD